MENPTETALVVPTAPATDKAGALSISINVTVTGKPEDAEDLAKAALAASKVLMPGLKLG